MELFEEEKLKSFISEKFRVSALRLPFYVKWIKMSIGFAGNTGPDADIKDNFLSKLSKNYPE
ncbi:MAG: hypothetical protein PF693_01150 [Spirochaetia bacterium]|nr:hypothetical protein [Spirochaetia bacterium]